MLRFFHQIRQRLLAERKFSKYLFYVISEVFIVIIGILLAFQVDNWDTQRDNRKEAKLFLNRLKNEFQANREQMEDKIKMREKALSAARELIYFVDGKSAYSRPSEIDSLLAYALPVYTFDPSLGVLNQLTSTDKLTLINNQALNDKLSVWNSMIEDFKEDENMYNNYNHYYFRPFLYKNYPSRNIINSRIKNRVINPILIASAEKVNVEIGDSNRSMDPMLLQQSLEFENYLSFTISWLSLINTQSQGVLNYIDSVLEMIDEELQTK